MLARVCGKSLSNDCPEGVWLREATGGCLKRRVSGLVLCGWFWGLLAGCCWLNATDCLLKITNWLAHVHTWNLVSSNAGWANEFKRARFRKYCRVLVQGSSGKVLSGRVGWVIGHSRQVAMKL